MLLKIALLIVSMALLISIMVLISYQDTEMRRSLTMLMFCLGFTSICLCFGLVAKS